MNQIYIAVWTRGVTNSLGRGLGSKERLMRGKAVPSVPNNCPWMNWFSQEPKYLSKWATKCGCKNTVDLQGA